MTTSSHQISDSLFLIKVLLESGADVNTTPAVETPTNHIVVIDCSGSMAYDLPKIREQFKKKLPKLLKKEDTVSIIWFSGRSQFGTLLEAEPVSTLSDLKSVNDAIDRWLSPVGLTGFKEPLEEVSNVVSRIEKNRPGSIFSLFFLSDGCDNSWDRSQILKACEQSTKKISSSTFVEYGYYADRQLLSAMAEKAGGTLIFSEDFDRYVPAFESSLQKKLSGAPRIEIKIKGDPIGGFAYALSDGDLITYEASSGKIAVPQDLKEVYYLSSSKLGENGASVNDLAKSKTETSILSATYAAMSLFSVRMKSDVVLSLLRATGDVRFIDFFAGLFGKQKYSDFMDSTRIATFDSKLRFLSGYDPNKVPKDDAFTVLDLLRILSEDDGNRLLLESSDFKYSKIGRSRVDSSANLTKGELEEIQKLTMQIVSEKDPAIISDITAKIASISSSKSSSLKFVADPAPDGYPIANLTYNEDRPNISVLVRKAGTVDVSSRLPASLKDKLTKVGTFIFRNYTIVKDGLVNVEKLPLKVTDGTWKKLSSQESLSGFIESHSEIKGNETSHILLLNLRVLPVINRKMVKSVSASNFFTSQFELLRAQADQKVYNYYAKDLIPQEKTKGFSDLYGEVAAEWLKEQGFTDYSGFSPKTIQAESTDFYTGKELKVSIKGYSKLPSMKELKEAIAKGKLNGPAQLMKKAYDEVEAFLASDIYKNSPKKQDVLAVWLDGKVKATRTAVRERIFEIAKTTFTLIVGQSWFSDFKSLDDNEMEMTIDGVHLNFKVEMKDIKIII